MIASQAAVIKLQEDLLTSKKEQLDSVQSAVKMTVKETVQDIVQTVMKSYSKFVAKAVAHKEESTSMQLKITVRGVVARAPGTK